MKEQVATLDESLDSRNVIKVESAMSNNKRYEAVSTGEAVIDVKKKLAFVSLSPSEAENDEVYDSSIVKRKKCKDITTRKTIELHSDDDSDNVIVTRVKWKKIEEKKRKRNTFADDKAPRRSKRLAMKKLRKKRHLLMDPFNKEMNDGERWSRINYYKKILHKYFDDLKLSSDEKTRELCQEEELIMANDFIVQRLVDPASSIVEFTVQFVEKHFHRIGRGHLNKLDIEKLANKQYLSDKHIELFSRWLWYFFD